MAKINKEDLILQLLESKNATCLLPLIEMVGNLDELVKKGSKLFVSEIPKEIDFCHKKLSDNDHIFEDIWETGTDEEIIKYGRERGKIRERRRVKKNEGVFLSRPGTIDLVDSLIVLLEEAKKHVTDAEAQVYFMKCREEIPPSSSKIRLAVDNSIPVNSKEIEDSNETHVEQGPISLPEVTVTKVEAEIKEEPTVENIEEPVEYRDFTPDQIQHSPKDSLSVTEGINEYRLIIANDTTFDISKLMDNWKDKFNNFEGNFKKDTIMEAYNTFYTNPKNSLEKAVADFAVWNHILPKILLKTTYFAK